MSLENDRRQNIQGKLDFSSTPRGEARPAGREETASSPARKGPSPLLSNLVLDELDRELERRGHRFVRYADDDNIYVRSERAGQC